MQSPSSYLPTGAWPADEQDPGHLGTCPGACASAPGGAAQGEVRKEEERHGDRALDLRE